MNWDIAPSNYPANVLGLDGRADWLLADNRKDFQLSNGEELLVPFTVRIDTDGKIDAELTSQIVGRLVEEDHLYIPSWYLTESIEVDGRTLNYPKPGSFFVAYAPVSFFELLAAVLDEKDMMNLDDIVGFREASKSIRLLTPLRHAQPKRISEITPDNFDRTRVNVRALDDPEPVDVAWSDDTVIMAVIDDGIAIANSQFQNLSGSRFEYFWKQDGDSIGNTVPTGRELTKAQIDALLTTSSVGGVLDEDTFYSKARLATFTETATSHFGVNLRSSHGAHIMDIATGFSKKSDVRNRPIIAVQLPSHVVEDTSGSELDHHIISAIDYIFERAEHLSPDRVLPLVINLSFGRFSGPHDGTSELEQFLDSKIAARGNTRIILPAGNSRQSRSHSVVDKSDFDASQGVVKINWRLQPDDKTRSTCFIWMPAEAAANPPVADRIKVSVVAPNGDVSSELGEVAPVSDLVYQDSGQNVCRVGQSFVGGATKRSLFTLSMMPTARIHDIDSMSTPEAVAPAGVWQIILKDNSLTAGTSIQCWIERDDTAFGYRPRGRQSYFDDPNYEIFDDETTRAHSYEPNDFSTTKRAGTLNGIATSNETIVVGAMYGKERTATDYSACGPVSVPFGLSDSTRDGPDMLTIADDSRVHIGIAGAGTRNGSTVFLNGTSVAAPRVAREVADLLAAGEPADRQQISQIVSNQEALTGGPVQAWNECSGNGRWRLNHPHPTKNRIDESGVGLA